MNSNKYTRFLDSRLGTPEGAFGTLIYLLPLLISLWILGLIKIFGLPLAVMATLALLLIPILLIILYKYGPIAGMIFYLPTTYTFGAILPVEGFPVSVNQLCGFILLVGAGFWLVRKKLTCPSGMIIKVLLIYMGYLLINTLSASSVEHSIPTYIQYVKNLLFVLIIGSAFCKPEKFKIFCWIFVLYNVLSAFIGLFEYITTIEISLKGFHYIGSRFRISGLADISTVFGLRTVVGLPIIFYLYRIADKVWIKSFLLFGFLLSVFVTFMPPLTGNFLL